MCKDCGCSLHSGSHLHEHTHENGVTHTHSHLHDEQILAQDLKFHIHSAHTHSHDENSDLGANTHTHSHTHEAGCTHTHENAHENHAYPVLNESKTINVIEKILSQNDIQASQNRAHFDAHGILALNLMSSPGAGKTTLLERTIKSAKFKIGVIEGDLETNRDADRVAKAGAQAHQITTGQACHLDAFMVHEGIHHLKLDELNLVFIENVGNLVCPASFDVGAHLNVVLISSPEGSDKISKYPVMFRAADLVIITKSDVKELFKFDSDEVIRELRKLNPRADVIELDSLSGVGFEKWIKFLEFKMELR